MTAALLDRLTYRGRIFETNSESHRFRESVRRRKRTQTCSPLQHHSRRWSAPQVDPFDRPISKTETTK